MRSVNSSSVLVTAYFESEFASPIFWWGVGILMCKVDVVGLYPNISHGEDLAALRKRLESRKPGNSLRRKGCKRSKIQALLMVEVYWKHIFPLGIWGR